MKKFFVLLVINGFVCTLSFSQVVLDNNPPSLKWQQVRAPHFNVLFPAGFEGEAQRLANTLEQVYLPESRTLGSKPSRISVVLQNQSSLSNAFVSITPRRAEFYTMPSQDYNFIGNNDWIDMIASHEYRHVVQFQHSKTGMNLLLYYLFGNSTLSSIANVSVPNWFWEGDAVATETAYTPTGRGSIPNFGLVFRTNLMEGRVFNYQKQYLRSYKNNIPNHYVLGYYMVSYLRKRTGDPMIWGKITSRAWSLSLVPLTFSNAIKREAGMHVTQLYNEMAADLRKQWKASSDTLVLNTFDRINPRHPKAYTDYLYPQVLEDGSIAAMKSGIGDIERIVRLDADDGKEEKLFVQGIINDTGMMSSSGGKIAWTEYNYDPRWLVRSYSVLKVYDVKTKRHWTVGSSRTRYAGAALSPDGTKVAAIQSDQNYRHALVVLDVGVGKVLRIYANPENYFYSMPRWSDDGKNIVALKTTDHGKSVAVLNAETGDWHDLLPPGKENIGYPVLHGDYLFFNSPISGIDNIYVYDLKNNNRYQVTSSQYGSYNPCISPDEKFIYYNDQGRNGMNVVKIPFDPSQWRPMTEKNVNPPKQLYEYIVEQEGRKNLLDSIPHQQFPVTNYSRLKGIINPYTWGAYFDNTFTQVDLGVASRDLLSTTSLSLGYRYDVFENTGVWRAGLSYQGLFPIIDVNVTYGNRKESTGEYGTSVKFNWKETGISTGLRVPLVLTKSKYLSELTISNYVGFTFTSDFHYEASGSNIGPDIQVGSNRFIPISGDTLFYLFNNHTDFGQLVYNNFNLSYSHSLKQSRRDFNPKFGQFLTFEHYSTPFGGDYKGWLWALRGSFYFPGIFKHHSLFFRAGYQNSYNGIELNTYSFRNRIFRPRGFGYYRDSKFYSFSSNYSLPLWYPDINIGPILNIQRIKANLFFDYGKGEGYYNLYNFSKGYVLLSDVGGIYQSYGIELTVDFNLFRFLPKFEAGYRITKIPATPANSSGLVYEFLIGNIGF